MKTFTNEDIRKWGACYDPIRYLKDDEIHTAISILNRDDIPFEDRLWAVCRNELLSDKLMQSFAFWCTKQVQHLIKNGGSLNSLDMADKFTNNEATKDELSAACAARRASERAAAWAAARNAKLDALWDTGGAVTWAVAWDAARATQKNKLIEMINEGIKTGDVK